MSQIPATYDQALKVGGIPLTYDDAIAKGAQDLSSSTDTLLASRREASKMEFEKNLPESSIATRGQALGEGLYSGLSDLLTGTVDFARKMTSGPLPEAEAIKELPGALYHAIKDAPAGYIEAIRKGDYDEAARQAGRVVTVTEPALYGGIEAAKPLSKPIGAVASDILGVTTGAGGEAIRTAYRTASEALTDAMRGKTSEVEIVSGLKDALNDVKDQRRSTYIKQLDKLPKDQTLDISPIKAEADAQLAKFNVKRATDAQGNSYLDFARSTIHDAEAQAKVRAVINDIDSWNSQAGDTSVIGVDTLKQRLADVYSPNSQARAFTTSVKKATDGVLQEVPGYSTMTRDYAVASDFIEKLEKEFSIGPNTNLGTTIRKIAYALKQNNEYRRLLIEALDSQTGGTLKEAVAGYHLRTLAPRGIVGPTAVTGATLDAILTHTLSPQMLPALLATSPRLVGETITAVGKMRNRFGATGPTISAATGATLAGAEAEGQQNARTNPFR